MTTVGLQDLRVFTPPFTPQKKIEFNDNTSRHKDSNGAKKKYKKYFEKKYKANDNT